MTKSIGEIIQEYREKGDVSGWFEEVYRRAQQSDSNPPWAYMQATPDLIQWAEKTELVGNNQTALVVGCGMGDDAEYLAERGFKVTAFDISDTAIAICKKRFPDTQVQYQQADLFKTPEAWQGKFDFVLENRTIQSLPIELHENTMRTIAAFVSEEGRILILCNGRDDNEPTDTVPTPLSHQQLQTFIKAGLTETYFDDIQSGSVRRFIALYQR